MHHDADEEVEEDGASISDAVCVAQHLDRHPVLVNVLGDAGHVVVQGDEHVGQG